MIQMISLLQMSHTVFASACLKRLVTCCMASSYLSWQFKFKRPFAPTWTKTPKLSSSEEHWADHR